MMIEISLEQVLSVVAVAARSLENAAGLTQGYIHPEPETRNPKPETRNPRPQP